MSTASIKPNSPLGPNTSLPTTPTVDATLTQLRTRISRYIWIDGLSRIAIWSIGLFWLFGLVDYLPVIFGLRESPAIVRLIMLLIIASGAVYIAVRWLWRPLRVRWPDRSLALLLEQRLPSLQGALVTWVEARQSAGDAAIPLDPQLRRMTAAAAEQRLAGFEVYDVLRWSPLERQLGVLGGTVALSLLIVMAAPSWSELWTRRLLGSDLAWPRKTQLDVVGLEVTIPTFAGQIERPSYRLPPLAERLTLPQGADGRLLAAVPLSSELVPRSCSVNYQLADGQSGRTNLRRLPADRRRGVQMFALDGPPLASVNQDASMTIYGGDARLPPIELEVVDPVEFLEVTVEVRYPDYLRSRPGSTLVDGSIPYRNGLRLPEGISAQLVVRSNVGLSRCDYQLTGAAEDDRQQGTLTAEGNELRLPLGQLFEGVLIELRPWDDLGHSSTDIKTLALGIYPDELPAVDLRLNGIGTAITPEALLPVDVTAKDDHGVSATALQVRQPDEEQPLILPLPDLKANQTTATFDLRQLANDGQLKLQPEQTITLVATAGDYYDLQPIERLGRSSPIQLQVVTPDDLLIVLDRRELDLRQRLEQVLIELNQLSVLMQRSVTVAAAEGSVPAEPGIITPGVRPPEDTPPDPLPGDEPEKVAADRLLIARIQESRIQAEKNYAELEGIAGQIRAIVAELQNNRIDSQSRQQRLSDKIAAPIEAVLAEEFTRMNVLVRTADNAAADGTYDAAVMSEAVDLNSQIIAKLDAILAQMLDIQDFNEVVDSLRDMIREQEELTERVKQEQRQRALDLFK